MMPGSKPTWLTFECYGTLIHLDLVAARDIGFCCIWTDRGTGRKAPPDYEPNAVLPTLDGRPSGSSRSAGHHRQYHQLLPLGTACSGLERSAALCTSSSTAASSTGSAPLE